MNASAVRELLHKRPFEPFDIHMSSGERFHVSHPEQVFIAGSRLLVYYPELDRVEWLSFLHVASISVAEAA